MTGTVFTNGMTGISWGEEGQQYQAVSNVDFRLLPALLNLEVGEVVYTIMPLVSASDHNPSWLPQSNQFEEDRAEYLLLQENTAPAALPSIDALHAYIDAHRQELEAQKAARDEAAANPPPPAPKRNSVITFWRKDAPSE